MPNNKIKLELESYAILEGSKPTNAIKLQSHYANLSNLVNFGRYMLSIKKSENNK